MELDYSSLEKRKKEEIEVVSFHYLNTCSTNNSQIDLERGSVDHMNMIHDNPSTNDVTYVLVGQDGQWDPSQCPTMMKHGGHIGDGKEDTTAPFYCVSITVAKPFTFQIVHSKLLWGERWYPPGTRDTCKRISRAGKGDEEVGHGKNWLLNIDGSIPPRGQKISIYFSPTTKCVTWLVQSDIDPEFQMPDPPKINEDSIWAAAQFDMKT